jgi:subtilase family serine protease
MSKHPVCHAVAFGSFRGKHALEALKAAALTLCLLTWLLPATAQRSSAGASNGAAEPNARGLHTARGTVVIPAASRANAGDLGLRAHITLRYIVSQGATPDEAPPFAGYAYETPASLACLYHVVTPIAGCNPIETINTPSGGSQAIAVVDAYDAPTAAADLEYFSSQFGLPFSEEKFQVVYAGHGAPPVDPTGSWEIEEAVDTEYAHAMAPNAKLYLVEADSNSFTDLFAAVRVATNLVACGRKSNCPRGSRGRGEVSMSWGGSEFASETSFDSSFTAPGIVYFASSGDSPGVIYPCASPNVVCAGGTSTARNQNTGNLIAEIAWSDAGGGISLYEPVPGYQSRVPAISAQIGSNRGVPDISADSNPNTGAWVFTNYPVDGYTGWYIVGGTSLASPTLAGVVNANGQFANSSAQELSTLYSSESSGSFNDITYGACGYYSGSFSGSGWDLCTGFGSPKNLSAR